MAGYGKTIRSLAAGLAGLLLTLVAWAQDEGASSRANAHAAAATIEIKGVLISPRSRSVLINGRVLRLGDRIGDVEIVAIDHREVRLRAGPREAAVSVGTSWSMDQLAWSSALPGLLEPAELQVATAMETYVEPTPAEKEPRRHAVAPGETLSEIAEAYLEPGIKRYQLMVALFEANPHAFRGNINLMRSGVVLDIPAVDSLANVPPQVAMAKVMEQTDRWRSERPRQTKTEQPVLAGTYGPVSSGETLSLIAYRLSQNAGEARTLMSALYRANPHAFGNSMNMLREGTVLRIPDLIEFDDRPNRSGTVVAHLSPD